MRSFPLAIGLLFCAIYAPLVFSLLFSRSFDPTQVFDLYYLITYNLIFFFLIPVIISTIFLKEKLNNFGLCIPKNKWQTIALIVLSLMLVIPAIVFISKGEQFRHFYAQALDNPTLLKTLLLEFTVLPIFYFSEEFFFRGFLCLHLWKKIGWHSVWMSDILFAWAHIAKPFSEFLLSIPMGMLLAFLTITTRSILPSIFVHYCAGLTVVMLLTP